MVVSPGQKVKETTRTRYDVVAPPLWRSNPTDRMHGRTSLAPMGRAVVGG